VREAIHALKFRGHRALARPLADLVAEAPPPGLPVAGVDLLVPVPLHPQRRAQRGFNQAELLARRLARRWGKPHRADVLARVRLTRPQTELAPEERRANVRGAFLVRRPELVAGRHVLLVDDVLTTGATVEACVLALREAGAGPVGVVTVARAL
jgi:ComF family protein